MLKEFFPTADQILDRLAEALGIDVSQWGSETALAQAIGVSTSTTGNWRRRDSLDFVKVLAICREKGISVNWLFFNEGPKNLGPMRWDQPEPDVELVPVHPMEGPEDIIDLESDETIDRIAQRISSDVVRTIKEELREYLREAVK